MKDKMLWAIIVASFALSLSSFGFSFTVYNMLVTHSLKSAEQERRYVEKEDLQRTEDKILEALKSKVDKR